MILRLLFPIPAVYAAVLECRRSRKNLWAALAGLAGILLLALFGDASLLGLLLPAECFAVLLILHPNFSRQEIPLTLLTGFLYAFLAGLAGQLRRPVEFALVSLLTTAVIEYIHERVLRREEDKTVIYQNKLLKQQMDEVETMYMTMRGWRHDFHNHLQVLKGYLKLDQKEQAETYLGELESDLTQIDTFYHSGNLQVDAILNSKCAIAEKADIRLNVAAEVPAELSVQDVDLCVILGNLMDNAIESCRRIEDRQKRFIRVTVNPLKKQLYLNVTNSTNEEMKIRTENYFTSKRGDHGYGLKRVDDAVRKYGGYLKRANEPEVFATEIVLPL
jgi:sensor histidine kinase YesM